MTTLSFDCVILHRRADRFESLTVEQFLALPLHERVTHVLARTVEFFSGETRVDRKLALAALRARELDAVRG